MKTENRSSLKSAISRCVNFALGEHPRSAQMRSVLVSLDDPGKWPINLNSIRSLDPLNKKDALFLITWYVSIRPNENVRELVNNGDQIFELLIQQETEEVMRTAIDRATWPTGYWKKDGKEAMEYRFGPEVVEAFDDTYLMNYLKSANNNNLE